MRTFPQLTNQQKMKLIYRILPVIFLLFSCGSISEIQKTKTKDFDYTLAFGSCNRQDEPQPLWEAILKNKPEVFIWGGDNIYADTDNMEEMRKMYKKQKNNPGYRQLLKQAEVYGTWDDHDYGINDGGKNWEHKDESQELLLDFLEAPEDDPRRSREGVYHSSIVNAKKGTIKLIVLDTRYFRDELKFDTEGNKRYDARDEGTILGKKQWAWLWEELKNDEADFTLIISSIQVLSEEHGFESWGNFPEERQKLLDLITASVAKNVILLSGDRHISEFSVWNSEDLNYPLVDFTSSGLTHSYDGFSGEPNQFRKGKVVKDLSFGLLKFDFDRKEVWMEMRGRNNRLQQKINLNYALKN